MDKEINEYDEEYINNITLENFKKNMKEISVEIHMLVDEAFTKRYNRNALEIIKTKLDSKVSWLDYFVTLDEETDELMKATLNEAKTGLAAVENLIRTYHSEKEPEEMGK